MIKNLVEVLDAEVGCQRQVCIIGAGTAGIFLAKLLRERGLGVVLLEAGDARARSPEERGEVCAQSGIPYRGANAGRSFGLGGTSVLWGGQMIPLTAADMDGRPALGITPWPIGYGDLAAHLPAVRRLLRLPADSVEGEQALTARFFPGLSRLDADFELRLSQWLPFGMRNFAQAFAAPMSSDPEVEVWLNTAVVGLEWSAERGRVVAVRARSPNGRSLTVRPEVLVVCAGALESTRLMLAFDEAAGGLLTADGAPLGRYFADHLSVVCGRFDGLDWRRYNLATAPIWAGGVMRTPRLELAPAAQRRLALTSAFAHFTFWTDGDTGFDVVRTLLRQRQGERPPMDLSPRRLWRAVTDVSAMAYWRGVHRRLWIPRLAELLLQVDIEQRPNWDSRLSLADAVDALGRKRLRIDWRIQPEDIRVIRTVAERTLHAWEASALAAVARLRLTLPEAFDAFDALYDVYHPTGTLRMGADPRDSVVDPDLRVWPLENCFISSTAVFPSAGSANPGLMHLALTARLAGHIGRLVG